MSWRCEVCYERDDRGDGCACDRAREAAERMPDLEAENEELRTDVAALRSRLAKTLWTVRPLLRKRNR